MKSTFLISKNVKQINKNSTAGFVSIFFLQEILTSQSSFLRQMELNYLSHIISWSFSFQLLLLFPSLSLQYISLFRQTQAFEDVGYVSSQPPPCS